MPADTLNAVLATLQNGVVAVNNLTKQLKATFPQAAAMSTTPASDGVVVFNSSLVTGFMEVTTSSGFVGYVPVYPSS